ncbi:flagellar biosynthesis protein FlhF [Metabacillus idriensis]|uniref:flagellar biosynthesis protein FlhF n=1 Tax=Metabacillus idriensis TaxID=324768 RepID=UPI00163AD773|nr:flagellar biosynthesis protein FlhF [Metabacillus idriensis]QNG58758.1 flagellar biosynthesis protein FlhF [Bacillus sp. PAMC26568]
MKVKKYIAPNMQEAMKKIKSELGQDAVILNSKVVHTGGVLGLFMKKKIEVIAALDPDPIVSKKSSKSDNIPFITTHAQEDKEPAEKDHSSLLSEVRELKNLVKSLSVDEKQMQLPVAVKKMNQLLLEKEIDSVRRAEIISEVMFDPAEKSLSELNEELSKVMEIKMKHLDFGGISYQKKYINVVGPTGVGKTTTLAKLAAESMLQKQKKIAFITTDTYRIAAIEQLKTYAKILDAPLEVCYSPEDFQHAKEKFKDMDMVFIDTAGRNFRNQQFVHDLEKLIDFTEEVETFLVLSVTSKLKDMLEIYENFSLMEIDKIIFTKLDETKTKGTMFDFILSVNKGVAYMTNGQNVPDDIMAATPKQTAAEIMR